MAPSITCNNKKTKRIRFMVSLKSLNWPHFSVQALMLSGIPHIALSSISAEKQHQADREFSIRVTLTSPGSSCRPCPGRSPRGFRWAADLGYYQIMHPPPKSLGSCPGGRHRLVLVAMWSWAASFAAPKGQIIIIIGLKWVPCSLSGRSLTIGGGTGGALGHRVPGWMRDFNINPMGVAYKNWGQKSVVPPVGRSRSAASEFDRCAVRGMFFVRCIVVDAAVLFSTSSA